MKGEGIRWLLFALDFGMAGLIASVWIPAFAGMTGRMARNWWGRAASWFPLSPIAGAGILSESGFTGLWDFQDFTGASLTGERLSVFVLTGFSVMAKIARWAK